MRQLGTVNAMRAISALVLRRLVQPIVIMIVILMVAGYALTAMLAMSFSAWWLLLLFILVPLTLFFSVITYVLWFFMQKLLPRQLSKSERAKVYAFSDKLFHIAERTKTPYPVVLLLIGKDVIRGRESTFLRDLIGDSKSVLKDFETIQKLF